MKFKELQPILQNLKPTERITLEKIGNALNIGKSGVSNRSKTESDLRPDEILKIENYFNVSLTDVPEWFLDDRKKTTFYDDYKKFLEYSSISSSDIIEIDRIEGVRPECGSGSVIFTSNIEPFKISRKSIMNYLRCTSPENLKTFKASGDSMENKISDGDWLLVDIGRTDASISGVYVFLANGLFRCKRLNVTLDGRLEVKSDNPKYDTEIIGPDNNIEIQIIGRVLNNLSRGL